ncbi:hypothetical protein VFPPC_15058 [Pochonia chlamydosporia 170]|uniref:Uncharacterized protein n=1 Tax=Pochonia chlamydosporia 170 TaxID=1380566 RepID=A0A179G2T0_METCM|nr:hypothetical protein VFPPC_15058 [Pochonia chlamydosporia 170]OAQ72057.1 hypothetical protein VFPPC_15058 [Pochonia chlamydosporia 170]
MVCLFINDDSFAKSKGAVPLPSARESAREREPRVLVKSQHSGQMPSPRHPLVRLRSGVQMRAIKIDLRLHHESPVDKSPHAMPGTQFDQTRTRQGSTEHGGVTN